MNLSKAMEKLMLLLISGCLAMPILTVYASEDDDQDINADTLDRSLESDGEYYEFPLMDADGNITMTRIPEVDPTDIETQRIEQADSFDVVQRYGDEEIILGSYDTLEEAQEAMPKRSFFRLFSLNDSTTSIRATTDYSNVKYGVVDFRTKPSNQNTNYTETVTGYSGYLNGSYGADGAFLGYCSTDKSKIKFRMAGVEGCVNASDVIVRNAEITDVKVSFYRVENGKLLHYLRTDLSTSYYTSVINVGLKQSYMKDNVPYFSYDGHYFYLTYEQMIDDYKNNTYAHSINPDQPYYNYFQFLSHRSKTDFTAAQLDAYTKSYVDDLSSQMNNLGSAFIANQNKYGANALLMYGVAANESAWGTSSIAVNKNNLFGHNATDFNPGSNANRYDSPADSVEHHAKNFISDGYLDPKDVSGRYFGAHLGDKGSGMNVKYASDPYWGEKAAAIANNVSQKNSDKDFGKYQIGMIGKGTNLRIRKEATTASAAIHDTRSLGNFPVLILSKTNGESINNNAVWYKIQSDPTLNADRSASTQGTYTYDFDKMYLYVSSEYVDLVEYTNGKNEIPDDGEVTYEKGDVNGDGRISPADYVKIKNHIMRVNLLDGPSLKAADVNNDGNVTPADYVKVKNIIMGK